VSPRGAEPKRVVSVVKVYDFQGKTRFVVRFEDGSDILVAGGRYPGGGQTSTNQVKEYKVYVTSDTVLKLEDQDMVFSDMHVGDRIIVSGIPKGSGNDLEATSIKRKF